MYSTNMASALLPGELRPLFKSAAEHDALITQGEDFECERFVHENFIHFRFYDRHDTDTTCRLRLFLENGAINVGEGESFDPAERYIPLHKTLVVHKDTWLVELVDEAV